MSRFLITAAAIAVSLPAAAAPPAKTEHGVRVWRAAAPPAVSAPALQGESSAACAHKTVIVVVDDWPARRLRTHGFWSGDGLSWEARLPMTTQGFFADRMAAGL